MPDSEQSERKKTLIQVAELEEQSPEPYPTARTITEEGLYLTRVQPLAFVTLIRGRSD